MFRSQQGVIPCSEPKNYDDHLRKQKVFCSVAFTELPSFQNFLRDLLKDAKKEVLEDQLLEYADTMVNFSSNCSNILKIHLNVSVHAEVGTLDTKND